MIKRYNKRYIENYVRKQGKYGFNNQIMRSVHRIWKIWLSDGWEGKGMWLMKPITDQVLDYLTKEIASGTWMVGEKIPSENQLIRALGVSRASLRSAIHRLAEVGVLKTIHGKGSYLMDNRVYEALEGKNVITAQEHEKIRKILEFRMILESEGCYLAVVNRTEQLVRDLESCLGLMKRYEGNSEQFVGADLLFHKALCKATKNPYIERSIYGLFEESKEDHCQMNRAFGYQDGIFYHTVILEAVKRGEAEEARELMRRHLQNGIERLERCPIGTSSPGGRNK